MANLRSSWHFVPLSEVPAIDGLTPLNEVYAQLSTGGHGGFILLERGKPQHYVRATPFAADVINRAKGNAVLLRELSTAPMAQLVAKGIGAAGLVPIDVTAVDVEADAEILRRQPERVFDIVESGLSIGWFMNHETVRETTTRKTWWICKNNHRNSDPDHGTCYFCPAGFVRTETD